jgi:hypothetical protein
MALLDFETDGARDIDADTAPTDRLAPADRFGPSIAARRSVADEAGFRAGRLSSRSIQATAAKTRARSGLAERREDRHAGDCKETRRPACRATRHARDADTRRRLLCSVESRVQKARRVQADLFVFHSTPTPSATPAARGSSVFALSEHGATSAAARWLAQRENQADLIGGVNLDSKEPFLAKTLLDLSADCANQRQPFARPVVLTARPRELAAQGQASSSAGFAGAESAGYSLDPGRRPLHFIIRMKSLKLKSDNYQPQKFARIHFQQA